MLQILLLLTLIPPATQQTTPPPDSCIVELMNLTAANWRFLPDSNYYTAPESFYKTVDSLYKNCLIHRDRKTIKMIFGQPTHKGADTYEYQIGPKTREAFYWYEFKFSNTGRLIEFHPSGVAALVPLEK